MVKLYCLILEVNYHFTVNVHLEDTVYDLKRAIKQETHPILESVAVNDLILWKSSSFILSDDIAKKGIVDGRDIVDAKQLESSLTTAWTSFFDGSTDNFTAPVQNGHVHLLVQVPPSDVVEIAGLRNKRRLDLESSETTTRDHPSKRCRFTLLPGSETIYVTQGDVDKPSDPLLPTRAGGFEQLNAFPELIAADKTKYIEELDKLPKYEVIFLRPRRWGKTTFLDTLANYYDKSQKARFNHLFRDFYIGMHPTPDRSSLLVLRFDFSSISGATDDLGTQFHNNIHSTLKSFLKTNQEFLRPVDPAMLNPADGAASLREVLNLVRERGQQLFVGVDEYDAPANTVLFPLDQDRFKLVADFFKTQFFATLKLATSSNTVRKYWITGVLPVFRDGISPLAATEIISNDPTYHGLCGFTDSEVQMIAQTYLSPVLAPPQVEGVMPKLRNWYNGYLFCGQKSGAQLDTLYNPQLVFTHLRQLKCGYEDDDHSPNDEIDAPHIVHVLDAIPNKGGVSFADLFVRVMSGKLKADIQNEFGLGEVCQIGSNPRITQSLLYYFGVFTRVKDGDFLKVPNQTMRHAIAKRVHNFLEASKTADQIDVAKDGLAAGDVGPLIVLLESFFKSMTTRAAKDVNEAGLRSILEAFWYTRELPFHSELRLLVNPSVKTGKGRYGFLDIIIPGSPFSSCIELKNATLQGLWMGEGRAPLSSNLPLQILQQKLQSETIDQLLERKVKYYDHGTLHETSIKAMKEAALSQVNGYLDVTKKGKATSKYAGVDDPRMEASSHNLIGYVVICVGATRVLGWVASQH